MSSGQQKQKYRRPKPDVQQQLQVHPNAHHHHHQQAAWSQQTNLIVALIALLITSGSMVTSRPTSRKPPFNGSIFGKRSSEPVVAPVLVSGELEAQPTSSAQSWALNELRHARQQAHLQALVQKQQQQDTNSVKLAVQRCLELRGLQSSLLLVEEQLYFGQVAEICDQVLSMALGFGENSLLEQTAESTVHARPVAANEFGIVNG